MRYTTRQDFIAHEIVPALGEYVADFDVEAISYETASYVVDHDDADNELLNTAGFEQVVAEDEFWAIAQRHDKTASAGH